MRSLRPFLVLLVACGDTRPCVDCPFIGGTYELTWTRATGFEDCDAQTPRPPTMELFQEGSTLHATLGDAGLTGTLYDTYDFTLSGGTVDRLLIRGRAVTTKVDAGKPDSGTQSDGGSAKDASVAPPLAVHLLGTLTWVPGDAGCEARDDFSGDRR